ncbi:MAG TPA: FAD-dependent oxidoreductase [Phycisphaerae bacterium]|nr:FAD-dependent oxidoreductase [Phycisphaerae bacterium]HRY67494.1 FAD-dependent oxidoreductase [Phycisphaerae bacterium]HSA27913.1 FAD-dependent oxidoreductase [Phycisphaerae bacterium]
MPAPRILIVGGVAGGASAATRARRMNESAEIVIFEKGEFVSFANCGLPYHIGEQIRDRSKLLVATPTHFLETFRIDVRTRHEVTHIDRAGKQIEVLDHQTGERSLERYDRLILSMGASPIRPQWNGVECSNVFTLRDMADTDRIKACVDKRKARRAVVVGAGFIGLEMVEALTSRGLAVSLVELQPQLLPNMDAEMAACLEPVLHDHRVAIYLGAQVESLTVEDGQAKGVRLTGGQTLAADLVVVSIGVRPNAELAAAAGLTIGASGAIAVNESLQTNDPSIYAAGDVAEVLYLPTAKASRVPLAGPANRNGRLAGQHAATGAAPAATPVAGSAIVGLFGKAAAMTGMSLKAARKAGFACSAAYAIRGHHAGYYPGAEQMILKLVFDTRSRRILGAQAVGGAGVDKRIDVIATAMRFNGTIDDLASVDLAYAPQFGAAKDPVHIAAFVAQNQLDGHVQQVLPGDPIEPGQLVDVRTAAEADAGTLPGAVNIPVQQLREGMFRLDKNKPVTVFCQVGQRGYVAARILMQSGFKNVRNLAGGYTLFRNAWHRA